MQILLYGDRDFTDSLNRDMLLLTLCFIYKTDRFHHSIVSLGI